MRALFFILLILNIGYFGWQFIGSSSGVATDMSALNGIEPIVLLSEVKAAELQAAKDKEAEEEAAKLQAIKEKEAEEKAIELQIAKEKETEERAAELQAAKEKEAEEKAAELQAAKDKEAEKKAVALQAAKDKEVKEKAAELQVAKEKADKEKAIEIQAAKEKEAKEKAAKVAAAKAEEEKRKAEALAASLAPDQCFTMGPFQDLENLRGLTRAIKSYVIEADFRGVEERLSPLYWVYTAAEQNKKATQAVAARLRAKNIKDFYLLHSDEKVNSISLGRFRNKQGVQKFVKKLEGLGFNVVVELVDKDAVLYWLDYRVAAGNTIPESVFKKFKLLKKQKVNRSSRQCS